jgi:hypothetical protein
MKYHLSISQAAIETHEDLRDLRDLSDLEQAITENDGKPLVPWDQAKALLDLD